MVRFDDSTYAKVNRGLEAELVRTQRAQVRRARAKAFKWIIFGVIALLLVLFFLSPATAFFF